MLTKVSRRDYRIDILRGLAIASVLLLHFDIAYRLQFLAPLPVFLGNFLHLMARNGNYGVTVFFVISGYLITSTSLRRFGSLGGVSPRVFYSFRVARILPCLILALTIITALAIPGIPWFASRRPVVPLWIADLSVLTFWHNILMAKVGYFSYCLNVYWSLSVEEVFYLTFPLLCLLRRTRWILPFWIAAIITGPIYRYFHATNEIEFLYGNFACFDAIALGCCIAVLAPQFKIGNTLRNSLQSFALIFMMWIYFREAIGYAPIWGTTLMAAGTALFLFAEATLKNSAAQSKQSIFMPLAWMGKRSYELYLFQVIVLAGMRNILVPKQLSAVYKIPCLALFFVISTGVAALVAHFYSEPLNASIRNAFNRRSQMQQAKACTLPVRT